METGRITGETVLVTDGWAPLPLGSCPPWLFPRRSSHPEYGPLQLLPGTLCSLLSHQQSHSLHRAHEPSKGYNYVPRVGEKVLSAQCKKIKLHLKLKLNSYTI